MDLTDRLRALDDWMDGRGYGPWPGLTEAADLLDAIDALHSERVGRYGSYCNHENRHWPCPTHRILHPDTTPPAA